ncbi:phage portal protein [Jeotgalibacillus malaysiensis]|uniref:phage portal protein n=1 Tax=Jeotgalibacillus malaysiensis TaxID=1508404 RepID=UPI0038500B0C
MTQQQKMNVRVIKADASASTKKLYEDSFLDAYGKDIIEPPYNLKELDLIAEYSTIMQQCIDAYKTNIVNFGFSPEYSFDYNADEVTDEKKNTADSQWTQLEEFIKYIHYDEPAETIFDYVIEDRESTGNGYIEVLRDGLNRPSGIEHVKAVDMRVCAFTPPEEVKIQVEERGQPKQIKRWRKFRKYVQMVGTQRVYFKEYGDPRIMDSRTGKFDDNTPENLRATEIVHFKIGSGVYGKPRWIGNIVNVYGARKAEELNLLYFKQGRHIPAAITVENGMLSDESYTQLQEYMNGLEGSDNAHKFLLLEAEGLETTSDSGQESPANVKVTIKSLAEVLQQDALFLEYDEASRKKLRSSFRLPPLYTGEADDYNRATADTARKITEEQVFQPERSKIFRKLNTLFLPDLDLSLVKLVLKGPDFRDPIETAKALYPLISAKALSPNDLRDLAGRVIGKSLEEFPEEEFDRPYMGQNDGNNEAQPLNTIAKSKNSSDQLINIMKDMRDVLEGLKQ